MAENPAMSVRLARMARGRTDGVRQAYAGGRRALNPMSHLVRRRVARSLQPSPEVAIDPDDGFRLFEPGRFPEADDAARETIQLLDRSAAVLEARRKDRRAKQFLVNLLDRATLTLDHPAMRFALRPDLLESITAYLGTVPLLRSVQVFYSGVVDREPISSQLYHCDADDTRQVKIFLLCSDVRHENGPLTILDAASSARVRRATGYAYDGRLTDEEVAGVLGPHQPFELVGAPGTSCVLDTSACFHYGSRVQAGAAPRLVTMMQFLTPFAFVLPGDWRQGAVFAPLASASLSPLQRAVLTGEHRGL